MPGRSGLRSTTDIGERTPRDAFDPAEPTPLTLPSTCYFPLFEFRRR